MANSNETRLFCLAVPAVLKYTVLSLSSYIQLDLAFSYRDVMNLPWCQGRLLMLLISVIKFNSSVDC